MIRLGKPKEVPAIVFAVVVVVVVAMLVEQV